MLRSLVIFVGAKGLEHIRASQGTALPKMPPPTFSTLTSPATPSLPQDLDAQIFGYPIATAPTQ